MMKDNENVLGVLIIAMLLGLGFWIFLFLSIFS